MNAPQDDAIDKNKHVRKQDLAGAVLAPLEHSNIFNHVQHKIHTAACASGHLNLHPKHLQRLFCSAQAQTAKAALKAVALRSPPGEAKRAEDRSVVFSGFFLEVEVHDRLRGMKGIHILASS